MHPIKKNSENNPTKPVRKTDKADEPATPKKRKKEHEQDIHHDPDLHGYSKSPTILPTEKGNKPL